MRHNASYFKLLRTVPMERAAICLNPGLLLRKRTTYSGKSRLSSTEKTTYSGLTITSSALSWRATEPTLMREGLNAIMFLSTTLYVFSSLLYTSFEK